MPVLVKDGGPRLRLYSVCDPMLQATEHVSLG